MANVEIRLDPNGTIFNLGSDTLFVLNAIQDRENSSETSLSLFKGHLRTIAARLGGNYKYTINTPTSVCGIRGTEVLNSVTETGSFIVCKSGLVDVISAIDPDNRTQIGPNQRVNTLAALFTPLTVTAEEVGALFNQLPFRKLNPADVPGQLEELISGEAEAEDEAEEEAEEEAEAAAGAGAPAADSAPSVSQGSREPSPFEQWLSNHMNMQLGSITIDGETWAKAVAQPVFIFDKVRLGLFLPIIYRDNFLDPDDWYHPEGNDEWSFGSDQGDWVSTLQDFNNDLWLKVRFFEYGDPNWDPFYLKAGNLETMTLGHGSLVHNYTNNTNFPSERMLGLNAGVKLGGFKLESLLDDASEPSLMGGRIQLRSGKPFALGIASVVDLFPAAEAEDPDSLGDPYLLGSSLDLELFTINTALVKLQPFIDVSTVLPIYRNRPDGTTFDTSDPFKLVWDDGTLKNYGVKGGVIGKLTLIDFMLDLRYENGLYRHNLFDNLYQRNRLSQIVRINDYLENPDSTDSTLGVYGEGGFKLFQEKVRLSAAYLWPWEIDGSDIIITDEDYFRLGLEIKKGLVPVYNISGAIYYERAYFASSIAEGNFVWLNEDSILTGEVVLPLAPTLDLAMIVSSSTVYDDQGNLIMESDGITPKVVPVFSIETRIHF